MVAALPASASAVTIRVSASADTIANDGNCSLREAVVAANTDTAKDACPAGNGTDTIDLPSGTFTRTVGGANEDAAATGDLDILANVTIHGAGAASTTIDGAHKDRVLQVMAGVSARIENVTITGGVAPNGAAGADAKPFADMGSPGEDGGGILNGGTLTIVDSDVTDNRAGNGGAGGTGDSTFSGNGDPGYGGAGGAGGSGGGTFSSGTLTMTGVRLTGNASGRGGDGGPGFGASSSASATNGGDGLGLYGGSGGSGGGLGGTGTGTTTVTDTTISANHAGLGGGGGPGTGGRGALGSGPGGAAGTGFGGGGGSGGSGGGVSLEGALTVTRTTVNGNLAGNGGPGRNGQGGTGGAGGAGSAGAGGAGGNGSGGPGGEGGSGGGVYHDDAVTAANVTVTGNSAGNGGSAGTGTWGAGGSGASHIGPPPTVGGTGGTGGNGTGGTGGYGGNGGGVRVANLALSQSTLSANAAGAAAAGAAGTGGAGGPGGPASGSNTKGADGPGGSGSGGAAGQSGAGGAIQTPTTATITSSILASNTPTNCAGSVGDGGYNIDFPESSCPGAAVDPLLSDLTANGGPTATQPLGAGSPAIDLVPVGPACSATDQTGHSRPVGADCDAGAHEVAPPAASTGAPQRNAMTGMVTPNLRVTRYHFEYGSTTTYGSATPDRGAGAGATPLPVTATAMGLVPGATYHYRLVATSTDGTATGVDRTLVAEDTVAPVLSHLSLTRSVFAVGPKATAIMARKRRGARGTTFRFTLSEAAGVKIAIQRAAKGRRNGKRCVKPSPKLRKAKKCTRYAGAGTLTRKGKAGANKVPFSGRIGPRPLPPGRYRAVLRATDAAGNRSKPKTVAFRIVRH